MNRAERRRAVKAAAKKLPLQLALTAEELAGGGAASEDDQLWFEAHPGRSHRLRPTVAYEFPGITPKDAAGGWTVVRQLWPGCRIRLVCWPDAVPPNSEAGAHTLFDLLLDSARTGIDRIPPDAVARRIAAMTTGGCA
jgi:hypothetical protein